MSKIYVPDLNNYKCVVVQNSTTLRAYKDIPRQNTTIEYDDYYYTSNYTHQTNYQTFSSYSNIPICLSSDELTDSVYYRNDFDSILIILFIILIIGFYFPYKIISRLFGRWLKI